MKILRHYMFLKAQTFLGNNAHINSGIIASENEIPNNLNNKIKSFILHKGFMATMAINADGTGLSQVYIASKKT